MKALVAVDGVELAGLIVAATPRRSVPGALWNAHGSVFGDGMQALASAGSLLKGVRTFQAHLGYRNAVTLAPADEAALRQSQPDVLLAFGIGTLSEAAAAIPRYGVWAFAHDLRLALSATPPGFWEVRHGSHLTEAMLVKRSADGEQVGVLTRGAWRTERRSFRANRDQLLREVATWPAQLARELLENRGPRQDESPTQPLDRGAGPPKARDFVALAMRVVAERLGLAGQRLFRHAQWNVGVIDMSIGRILEVGEVPAIRWLPVERGRFLADPFGLAQDGKVVLLCEEYRYAAARGRICAAELGSATPPPRLRPVIERPFHLSYPYLVRFETDVYCIPETHRQRQVVLYRSVRFPDEWEEVAILIEGFPALDPTVFQFEDHWWLACTDADRGADSHLCFWYSRSLLGPWAPHRGNPVKIDVRSSRPGGTPFYHAGVLHRPAQDCSVRYGARLIVNQVRRLTPTEFEEVEVAKLEPARESAFPAGLHTVADVGDITVVDGLRYVFSSTAMRKFVGFWVGDLVRRRTT